VVLLRQMLELAITNSKVLAKSRSKAPLLVSIAKTKASMHIVKTTRNCLDVAIEISTNEELIGVWYIPHHLVQILPKSLLDFLVQATYGKYALMTFIRPMTSLITIILSLICLTSPLAPLGLYLLKFLLHSYP